MHQRQMNYGKFFGKIEVDYSKLSSDVFYLSEVDDKWRRKYNYRGTNMKIAANKISETAI
jgi:hypothetical protein